MTVLQAYCKRIAHDCKELCLSLGAFSSMHCPGKALLKHTSDSSHCPAPLCLPQQAPLAALRQQLQQQLLRGQQGTGGCTDPGARRPQVGRRRHCPPASQPPALAACALCACCSGGLPGAPTAPGLCWHCKGAVCCCDGVTLLRARRHLCRQRPAPALLALSHPPPPLPPAAGGSWP